MIKDLLALAPRRRATNPGADNLPAVAVLQNFHPQEHFDAINALHFTGHPVGFTGQYTHITHIGTETPSQAVLAVDTWQTQAVKH